MPTANQPVDRKYVELENSLDNITKRLEELEDKLEDLPAFMRQLSEIVDSDLKRRSGT